MYNEPIMVTDVVEDNLHEETVANHEETDVQMPLEKHNVIIVVKWGIMLAIVTKNNVIKCNPLIT